MKLLQTILELAITHLAELWIRGEIEENLFQDLIHDMWEILTAIKSRQS